MKDTELLRKKTQDNYFLALLGNVRPWPQGYYLLLDEQVSWNQSQNIMYAHHDINFLFRSQKTRASSLWHTDKSSWIMQRRWRNVWALPRDRTEADLVYCEQTKHLCRLNHSNPLRVQNHITWIYWPWSISWEKFEYYAVKSVHATGFL